MREGEAGAKTAGLCRKHGISAATFYNWKAKFGGMDVSEAKRLWALEAENAKLKQLSETVFKDKQVKLVAQRDGGKVEVSSISDALTGSH